MGGGWSDPARAGSGLHTYLLSFRTRQPRQQSPPSSNVPEGRYENCIPLAPGTHGSVHGAHGAFVAPHGTDKIAITLGFPVTSNQ